MSKPKAPQPADPQETAAAQTSQNVSTAIANAFLGNVNQVTPEGGLTFDQTGSYQLVDRSNPDNPVTYDIPRFTATQTYSPEQEEIYGIGKETEKNIATIGRDQSARIGELLGSPVSLGNEATEARLFELGRKRLDPMFAQSEESLRTRLANQGIQEGSTAFDRAMTRFGEGKTDAYNQLLLGGRGLATQEQLAERNQPINEITALLSGSQVSQPNFVNASMPQIPTTDFAGIQGQYDANKLNAWQAQQQFGNNLMGGLFQLGSGVAQGVGAYYGRSDVRLKRDIIKVGNAANGLPLYLFNYMDDPEGMDARLGLMAHDVEKVCPEAVITGADGYKRVNYSKALAAPAISEEAA